MLDNRYNPNQAISVNFNFTSTSYNDYSIKVNRFKVSDFKPNLDLTKEYPLNLPLDMNYLSWGAIIDNVNSTNIRISNLYVDFNKIVNRFIEVTFNSKTDRTIKVYTNINKYAIATFSDKIINKYGEFIRVVDNKTYHIKNNQLYFI